MTRRKVKNKVLILTLIATLAFTMTLPMVVEAKTQIMPEEKYFIGFNDPVLLDTFGPIKVYGSKTQSIVLPFEVNLARSVVFENTSSDKIRIALSGNAYLLGEGLEYIGDYNQVRHPHPGNIYLNPGEKKVMSLTFELSQNGTYCKNKELNIGYKINIGPGQNYEGVLKNKITVLSRSEIKSYSETGIIKGKVVNSNGKALSGIRVRLRNSAAGLNGVKMSTVTNKYGKFSFKVPTYKNQYNNNWSTYSVAVNPPKVEYGGENNQNYKSRYGIKYKVIVLKTGMTSNSTYKLGKAASKLSYSTSKVMDLGVQAYTYSASKDGETIAFVPFHAEGFADSKQILTVTDKKGTILFKKPLGKETPAGDVSKDGKYIAVTLNDQQKDAEVVICNRSGEELYSCQPHQTNTDWQSVSESPDDSYGYPEVKLSDDNKYLAVGSWGNSLYLIDWKNDKIMWEAFTFGMIREIRFDGDLVYASCADGYLRCYRLSDGTMKWEQFTTGWACELEVSEHYVAVTAKQGGSPLYMLNKSDGSVKWTYPLGKRGNGIKISNNEKYIWYGNDISGGCDNLQNMVLSISTGKPIFCLPSHAQMAGFFSNDKYLAVKNGSWIGIFQTSTGEQVFTKNLAPKGMGDSISQTLWASEDGKNLVTVVNNNPSERFYGQAYFLTKK